MKQLISSVLFLSLASLGFAEESTVVRESEKEVEVKEVCEKHHRKIHKQPVKKLKCKIVKE